MKIVIEAEYPQCGDALEFVKSIAESSNKILAHTPEGLSQTLTFNKEGIKIKITK